MKRFPAWLPLVLLALSDLPAQTGSTVDSIPLQSDRAIESEIAAGQSHGYQLALQAGQHARVRVEQRTVNVALVCFGPDGRELFAIDTFGIGDTEEAELIADTAGTYRLRLSASEPQAPNGRYQITLDELGASTEQHRHRIAAARAFAEGMRLYRQGTREAMLQAIQRFSVGLVEWNVAGDLGEVARTLYTSGLTYIEIGDQQKALEYTAEALEVARRAGDRIAESRALNMIGEVHNYFGDKRKAIGYYEQALHLMRGANDRAGEGTALNNVAVAYAHTGDRPKAITLFRRSEQIFRDLQDRQMLAEVFSNLGVTYDNLSEYQKALESHQYGLALKRELGERPSQAVSLNNIGTAYAGLGGYQKALDAYTAALEINRSLDNRRNVAINLNNIAWVYDQLADLRRALTLYEESLEIVRAINDRHTTAVTLNNIGEIYSDLGDYRKAYAVHSEALLLRRAVGHVDGEANSLNHLGAALAKLGERDKAREYFEKALAIHRRSGNRYMLARTLTNLGALERELGNCLQAQVHLSEAVEISRAIHDKIREATALTELSRVARIRGKYEIAHQRAEEALVASESVRLTVASPALRASFVSSVRDVHELNVDLLMRLHSSRPDEGYGAAALFATERGRARSLLELLRESGAEIRRGVDTSLLERERELERLIARKAERQTRLLSGKHSKSDSLAASKELDQLGAELEQVQSRIRTTSPQYAALTQPLPLKLQEIQTKVLDEDTILLEYALGSEKSFLWAVTPTSMEVFELPPRTEVESVAKRVYDLLTARNLKPLKETPAARANRIRQADEAFLVAARKASGVLLGAVAPKLEHKRLLVVGEGVLQYLPFGALPEPGRLGEKNPPPLIANHEILTAPSASVMAVLRQEAAGRQPAEKAVAIIADPVFSAGDGRIQQQEARTRAAATATDDFLRLRFSRYEADQIARLAPAASTLKAIDFDASRETVLNPDFARYRIVHFATHSLINNERPELSGVVLSLFDRSGHPQNGFLRLYDIYNLRLGSDLVVLSACQTALGGEIKGEGLIGLTRGFLYAGAPRVVATLWEVDDRTTAELMRRFYEGMLGRHERTAAALRAAQVALWKSKGWDSPYYWAGFTLQGEWR